MIAPANTEAIRSAIRQLFAPGQLVELRALPKGGGPHRTNSGYFNDFDALERAILQLDNQKFAGVYYTLNPVSPDLLAHAANRVRDHADVTTKDADIVHRFWFLIDVDPVRKAGISATDAEKEQAQTVRMAVQRYLRAAGWPEPLLADSGNGYHLLYRVDLPNDDAARDLLANCLKALAARFDQPGATIDTAVFNASRIIKAYGSMARKGDTIEHRPWRRSQLLSTNGTQPGVVTLEQLQALAAEAPAEAKANTQAPVASSSTGNPDPRALAPMEAFLETYNLAHDAPVPFHGGVKWKLAECVFNSEHRDAAVLMSADGALGFHCFHDSCKDKGWKQMRAELENRTGKAFSFTRSAAKPSEAPAEFATVKAVVTDDLSDCGNADRLVASEGENLRFCYEMGRWLIWDGRRWKVDSGQQARARMEETMRRFLADVLRTGGAKKKIRFALGCLDRHRLVNGLAEAEKKLGVNAAELDRHPTLLTFRNGTLNLETGALGPHDRTHLITKLIRYHYNPDAQCPRFLEFLSRAVGPEAVPFVQELVGYSLGGDTTEKIFMVVFGPGDTGKTTFLELLRGLLSEYAMLLQVDTLMERRHGDNAIQEDLADLRGVRLATTSEIDRERRLSISTMKRITQGQGMIAAARKYEHRICFPETHKLWLDTNHLPVIPADETPIWKRLTIVAFRDPLPKRQQNERLCQELLRDEGEGILAWAVQGELRRREKGLGAPPTAFMQEKGAWLEEMDEPRQFIEECCKKGEGLRQARQAAYEAFARWRGNRGRRDVISPKQFTDRLMELGYPRTNDRRFYLGLLLLDTENQEELWKDEHGET